MEWTRGRTIGRGSTATVSIATADQSGHIFAVKSSALSQSESLRREQRILSQLNCPHVVAYKGCDISFENGKLLYNLFLEYVPGGTITEAIQNQGGGLDEAVVQSYTRGTLLGLEILHSNGIVHCDIKGQNILVMDEGGVKIADLGCARRTDEEATAAWSVAGTPVYMAPEVARGEQQGFPADVWALGCTVIEMATGRSPWPNVGDPVTALYRIGFSSDMPEIPSNISKQARDFLNKCLKRDPAERWSVNELLGHEFIKESEFPLKKTDGSKPNSPNSVLHQQIWDSMEESETIQIPPRKISLRNSLMERIRELGDDDLDSSSKMPNWECGEDWLTVRSNTASDIEMLSDRQGVNFLLAEQSIKDYESAIENFPTNISENTTDNASNNSRDDENRHKTSSSTVSDGDSEMPNDILVLMEETECKRPIHGVNTSQDKSCSLSINNIVSEPSSIFTRLHAGYFRITLSLGAQALLWKILTEPNGVSQHFWHVFFKPPSVICLLLWCLAVLAQISLSFVYVLRCLFHFHLVKAEFFNHIGVNYLYAPWISWLILLQSSPTIFPLTSNYSLVLCWIFTVALAMLDIKIYGQWLTTERRFLSITANPTSQISVIGNLVAARAAAQMGWKQSALCMWSLGMVHYLVLFVTLYQHLSGGNCFPSMLQPTFFLFFATPSMASSAWNSIAGAFDNTSKMLFFLSLFLFMSLACRPYLFKKSMSKFSVAWWAYSFPLSFLALAAAEYTQEVKGHAAAVLMLVLSILSLLVFIGLMLLTAANANQLLVQADPTMSFYNNIESSA